MIFLPVPVVCCSFAAVWVPPAAQPQSCRATPPPSRRRGHPSVWRSAPVGCCSSGSAQPAYPPPGRGVLEPFDRKKWFNGKFVSINITVFRSALLRNFIYTALPYFYLFESSCLHLFWLPAPDLIPRYSSPYCLYLICCTLAVESYLADWVTTLVCAHPAFTLVPCLPPLCCLPLIVFPWLHALDCFPIIFPCLPVWALSLASVYPAVAASSVGRTSPVWTMAQLPQTAPAIPRQTSVNHEIKTKTMTKENLHDV